MLFNKLSVISGSSLVASRTSVLTFIAGLFAQAYLTKNMIITVQVYLIIMLSLGSIEKDRVISGTVL